MRIALCQIDTITGNIAANTRLIINELTAAARRGTPLAVFPEMTLTGYPPRDLLEYESFIARATEALEEVRSTCAELGVGAILGTLAPNTFGGKQPLLNAAAHIAPDGTLQFITKKLLPNYDVFDEHRYFRAAPPEAVSPLVVIPGAGPDGTDLRLGISVCEDIWNDNQFWKNDRLYEFDPIEALVQQGANVIINISASPFVIGKPARRLEMLRHTARRWNMPVLLVNQVGGCDQVVFDGGSCVVLPNGQMTAVAGWFRDVTVDWDTAESVQPVCAAAMVQGLEDDTAQVLAAIELGLRKTGFTQVLVGNSGGIDSAVVTALAVDALGAENVISVSMPGPFTSHETHADATALAANLGVRHFDIPIVEPFDAFKKVLGGNAAAPLISELFHGDPTGVSHLANENLQARLRGNILMWISNAIRNPLTMVLSTGNKSEVAVGYCTLYGDMCGGLSVISDVPKMMVYQLAALLNERLNNAIPQSVLDRAPSAELAPDQKDSDSLPPYPILDEIVRRYVEEREGAETIIAASVADRATVERTLRMIDRAEYKRAQAAPGIKVTSKAFGVGRRMPIARGKV
jgi:NAD+ synthetase